MKTPCKVVVNGQACPWVGHGYQWSIHMSVRHGIDREYVWVCENEHPFRVEDDRAPIFRTFEEFGRHLLDAHGIDYQK